MSNNDIKEPEKEKEETDDNKENKDQNNDNKDTITVIKEEYERQIAELRQKLIDQDKKHKEEIIEILKSNNGTSKKKLTEEEQDVQNVIENINKYRR